MTIADKVALELLAKALYDDQNTSGFYNWNNTGERQKWRKRAKELIDEQSE